MCLWVCYSPVCLFLGHKLQYIELLILLVQGGVARGGGDSLALVAVEERELPELVSRPANSNVLLGFVDAPVQDAAGTDAFKYIRRVLGARPYHARVLVGQEKGSRI